MGKWLFPHPFTILSPSLLSPMEFCTNLTAACCTGGGSEPRRGTAAGMAASRHRSTSRLEVEWSISLDNSVSWILYFFFKKKSGE